MRPTPIAIIAFFLLAQLASAEPLRPSRELFQLWAKLDKPLASEPDPIGTYTAGCLAGAKLLPLDGVGYSVMRPSRLRFYGHSELVAFIEELGRKMKSAGLPLLLVGDMGRPRGGPMISGHSSHQIGLDVDLWYELSKKKPSMKQRESWGADPFANIKKNELSPAWRDSQRKLLALVAEAPAVERIFVHPVIKRDICQKNPTAAWQYKLRAWWNHHDHLHARLRCPAGSANCSPQEPLDPLKNGCGEELAWWFSEEAKAEGQKKAALFAAREFPELPPACGQMVQQVEESSL